MTSEPEVEWLGAARGEPVELRPASPRWRGEARVWTDRIRVAVAPLPVRVEHIGSTAVPGLDAKPVLDLQVAVPAVGDEAAYRPALESLGLVLRARERHHRFFRPPAERPRTVHVHVCERGSRWERDHLRFRDLLRTDAALAARYAALKRALAAEVGHDRGAYNAGKTAFIAAALAAGGPPPPEDR